MDVEAIMRRLSAMTFDELHAEIQARDDQMNAERQANLDAERQAEKNAEPERVWNPVWDVYFESVLESGFQLEPVTVPVIPEWPEVDTCFDRFFEELKEMLEPSANSQH